MLTVYFCNSFSLSMLDREAQRGFAWNSRTPRPISDEALMQFCFLAREGKIKWESAVDNADTAWIFANLLGLPIQQNRIQVKLNDPDRERAIIGQYEGPQLPPGASLLPDSFTIEWWIV